MKLDKLTFISWVTTVTLTGATIPCAAVGGDSVKSSTTLHSFNRLEDDERILATDMEKLRRHLRHGASESEIDLERIRIRRDWQNIVAERGSKPAELSSRLATFHPSWRFSSSRHLKKNRA